MYLLTCPNGKPHDFNTPEGSDEYVCSTCGVSFQEFNKADQMMTEMKEKVKDIAGYTNGGDPEFLAFVMFEAMRETHRTIQQNFFRGIVAFIDKMKDMPVDPRNQACVEWCKEASKIDRYFPSI